MTETKQTKKPIMVMDHNGYVRFIGGECKANEFTEQINALKQLQKQVLGK